VEMRNMCGVFIQIQVVLGYGTGGNLKRLLYRDSLVRSQVAPGTPQTQAEQKLLVELLLAENHELLDSGGGHEYAARRNICEEFNYG